MVYDKDMRHDMRRDGWTFGKGRDEQWRLPDGTWVDTSALIRHLHALNWSIVLEPHDSGVRGDRVSHEWLITTPDGLRWEFARFLRTLRDKGYDHAPAVRERYILANVEYTAREVGPLLRSMGWRQVEPILDTDGNIVDSRKGVLRPPATRWFTSDECDACLSIAWIAAIAMMWNVAPSLGEPLSERSAAVDDGFGEAVAGMVAVREKGGVDV